MGGGLELRQYTDKKETTKIGFPTKIPLKNISLKFLN